MSAGKNSIIYNDKADRKTYTTTVKVPKNGGFSVTIQPNGGFVLTN
jgi:hypothetical protein